MPKEEVPQEQAQYIDSLCSMLLQMLQTAPSHCSSGRHWFLQTRPWFYCPQIAPAQRGASLRSGFLQVLPWQSSHPVSRDSTILLCSDHNKNCTRMLARGDPVPVRQILPCKVPWASHPWVKIPGMLKEEHANHIYKTSPTGWPEWISPCSPSQAGITSWFRWDTEAGTSTERLRNSQWCTYILPFVGLSL